MSAHLSIGQYATRPRDDGSIHALSRAILLSVRDGVVPNHAIITAKLSKFTMTEFHTIVSM